MKKSKSIHSFVQPASKVEKVIDTTGCGDSCQAGFGCSYYFNCDIKKAMLAEIETIAYILTYYGGV